MSVRPTYEAIFFGGPGDHADGTVRRIEMVKHPTTWEWVRPEIVTSWWEEGTAPVITGRYEPIPDMNGLPAYRWVSQ